MGAIVTGRGPRYTQKFAPPPHRARTVARAPSGRSFEDDGSARHPEESHGAPSRHRPGGDRRGAEMSGLFSTVLTPCHTDPVQCNVM